jgi:uncharacterized repeat protein (TIGR03837 family)
MQGLRSWDVFCHVVDNYGDAAVCWRLAQRLAADYPTLTRLWIDNLAALHALRPEISIDLSKQFFAGVEIRHWVADADFGRPADVVIDAFGCGLPDEYAQAMAARLPKSLWVVLEYLSAEPWVASHHGLPSPHPRLPLERFFFFPGFEADTGGLLREPGLAGRREEFLRHPVLRQTLWRNAGFALPDFDATVITLFSYENPAVVELLDAWAGGATPIVAAVPQSRLSKHVAAYFGASGPAAGSALRRGALEVRFLPFLSQDRYDELLWVADWNFVRGEDSFVRAQWAERPFVWHLYPQAEWAHLAKLDAFLDLYCRGLPGKLALALQALWHGWNDPDQTPRGALGQAWTELSGQSPACCEHAHNWAWKAAAAGDLAVNLARFCANRLK